MSEWKTVTAKPKTTPKPKSKSDSTYESHSEPSDPWGEVTILRKTTPLKATDPKNSVIPVARQVSNQQTPTNKNAHILDAETSSQPIEKVSLTLGQAVAKARITQKLTQRELALKTNGKVTFADIQLIESGKAFSDNNKIVEIERALNIHLRGKHEGEPLFKKSK